MDGSFVVPGRPDIHCERPAYRRSKLFVRYPTSNACEPATPGLSKRLCLRARRPLFVAADALTGPYPFLIPRTVTAMAFLFQNPRGNLGGPMYVVDTGHLCHIFIS